VSWRRVPENAAAYARAEAFWEDSAKLSNDPDILRALHGAAERRHRTSRFGMLRSTPAVMLTAAILLVAFLVSVASLRRSATDESYQTAVGERSTARLPDGSSVQLDTDSAAATRFSPDQRRIQLTRGQAYFQVAHASARPFVVDAGDGITITATGTQFDVRRLSDRVIISLVEGSVTVRRGSADLARMTPGSVIAVAVGAGVVPANRTIDETTGWRRGHLTFRDMPLADAVAEVNRYTERKFKIGRPGADEERVSGEFSTSDPEGFQRAVNTLLGDGTLY